MYSRLVRNKKELIALPIISDFMKVFFLKNHSFYKIFKTLEKLPPNKSIHIFIDPEHSLFENDWWWKQIKEVIESKKLDIFFVTKTEKCRKFFDNFWMKTIYKEKNKILKLFNFLYLFLFNIKKFHMYAYTRRNYVFYLVFLFELSFIFWILYVLYILVLPSAKIIIKPSEQIENVIYNFRYYPNWDQEYENTSRYINLPYYSWYIDYKYDMAISVSHVKYIQNPSEWYIRVNNTTESWMYILPNTKFITDDWLIFQSTKSFDLPAWKKDQKLVWEAIVKVVAMEYDFNNALMWTRWNITKWTKLYIQKLKSSFYLKEIYAEAIDNLYWWSLKWEWTITEKDIQILSWKLATYITQQKKNIVSKNFNLTDSLFLPFVNMIKSEIKNISIENKIWESWTLLKWSVIARLSYVYVKKEDLNKAFQTYILQRNYNKIEFLKLDFDTLKFLNAWQNIEWAYIIPTKIAVVQWYNFKTDIDGIMASIKNYAVGKDMETVKQYVSTFIEIASVKMKIRPPRYSWLPKLKSRISVELEN